MDKMAFGTPATLGGMPWAERRHRSGWLEKAKVALFAHFELVLIGVLLTSLLFINFVVVHKFAFLLFYFVPVLMAGFYLSARYAVTTALLTVGFVAYLTLMDPFNLQTADTSLGFWNLTIWACFLTLAGAMVGQLQDQNQQHARELRDAYAGIIRILVRYLEATDAYTKSHSERVASVAVVLARKLGMSVADMETLWSAALLHDVGKIEVIDLIRKAAPLSEDERVKVDAHTELGAQLILTTGGVMNDVIPLILDHHRRYEEGQEGIPLGARIITVADTYDAIVSDRPYRAGRMHFEAMQILEAESGTQFDPAVVNAMRAAEHQVVAVYEQQPPNA